MRRPKKNAARASGSSQASSALPTEALPPAGLGNCKPIPGVGCPSAAVLQKLAGARALANLPKKHRARSAPIICAIVNKICAWMKEQTGTADEALAVLYGEILTASTFKRLFSYKRKNEPTRPKVKPLNISMKDLDKRHLSIIDEMIQVDAPEHSKTIKGVAELVLDLAGKLPEGNGRIPKDTISKIIAEYVPQPPTGTDPVPVTEPNPADEVPVAGGVPQESCEESKIDVKPALVDINDPLDSAHILPLAALVTQLHLIEDYEGLSLQGMVEVANQVCNKELLVCTDPAVIPILGAEFTAEILRQVCVLDDAGDPTPLGAGLGWLHLNPQCDLNPAIQAVNATCWGPIIYGLADRMIALVKSRIPLFNSSQGIDS